MQPLPTSRKGHVWLAFNHAKPQAPPHPFLTPGGFHVPFPAGRIEGGVSFGQ